MLNHAITSQNLFEATVFSSFLYTGKRPDQNVEIMVLETDYSSYAMLVFKRAGKITMKLYGRCYSVYFSLNFSHPFFIVIMASVCSVSIRVI